MLKKTTSSASASAWANRCRAGRALHSRDCRLATANPVVLDDALVHSDGDRIEKILGVGHRQSSDQAIIVFACRQRAFRKRGGNVLHMKERTPSFETRCASFLRDVIFGHHVAAKPMAKHDWQFAASPVLQQKSAHLPFGKAPIAVIPILAIITRSGRLWRKSRALS